MKIGKIILLLAVIALSACNIQTDSKQPLSFQQIQLEGPALRGLTDFKFLPGTNNFLALNRAGIVQYYELQPNNKASYLGTFQIGNVFNQGDCAANALQLDPDFTENRFFYVAFCTDLQSSLVMRYIFDAEYFSNTPSTGVEILRAGDSLATKPQHAIDSMTFDRTGAMLISLGEKGRPQNAQDQDVQLGKILRIIPNRDPQNGGGYEVPADNPFVGQDGKDPLIYAFGLRNPWRTAKDGDGRYWIGDVGGAKFEEINVMTKAGQNFGWNKVEGKCLQKCDGFTDPILTYTHAKDDPFIKDDPLAVSPVAFRAIWVGLEYRPVSKDRYQGLLKDLMLFGDFYMGWIRGLRIRGTVKGESIPLAHFSTVVSMQQGPDDYIYAATLFSQSFGFNDADLTPEDNGGLWRIVDARAEEETL